MIAGGPDALQTIIDCRQRPAKADYGPQLEWERPVFVWFSRMRGADPHVDANAWWRVIEHEGWDPDLAWRLLIVVESTFAEAAVREAEGEESRREAAR